MKKIKSQTKNPIQIVEFNKRRFHIDKYLQQASNRKYKYRGIVEVWISNT